MPVRPKRSAPPLVNAADHPIAWFSALLRGAEQRDRHLVRQAQSRLEELGYSVVLMPGIANDRGKAVAR
jgi:hypothetical protein